MKTNRHTELKTTHSDVTKTFHWIETKVSSIEFPHSYVSFFRIRIWNVLWSLLSTFCLNPDSSSNFHSVPHIVTRSMHLHSCVSVSKRVYYIVLVYNKTSVWFVLSWNSFSESIIMSLQDIYKCYQTFDLRLSKTDHQIRWHWGKSRFFFYELARLS